MAPIITVHRGELLQIKRMIEKGKGKGKGDVGGDIYGLRTESRQPVIQFVCGQNDTKQRDMLQTGHGLLKLGNWVLPRSEKNISRKDVILVFSDEGEFITAYDNGDEATPDILKGQSAFRLHEPLTMNLDDLAPIPTEEYDKENEHKEAEVTKEQWYSAPEGVTLLQEIYQTFPKSGITNLNMSRDKATEDISLSLTADSTNIIVHFPPYFPYESPKVQLDGQNDWSEVELQYEKTMRPEEHAVTLLCVHLWNLVNEKNKKKQQQKQSNKNNKKENKKNKKKSKAEVQIPNQLTPAQMREHDKQHQDDPSTGQKQAPPTGEYDQQHQDEPSTVQEQATPIGEHDQPQRDEPSTVQEQATPIGEHDQQHQDEPSTVQEQATPIGEHEQPRDESSTGQEQATPIGEHEQRDEPPTGQEQATPIGEHEQRDKPPTRQEQASTPKNKTDEVIEQTPEEKMDIDCNVEQLQETSYSEENMEVDEHDHTDVFTKF